MRRNTSNPMSVTTSIPNHARRCLLRSCVLLGASRRSAVPDAGRVGHCRVTESTIAVTSRLKGGRSACRARFASILMSTLISSTLSMSFGSHLSVKKLPLRTIRSTPARQARSIIQRSDCTCTWTLRLPDKPCHYPRKVPPAVGLPGSSEDLKLARQSIDHRAPCRLVRHEPKFFTCVPARQASRGRCTRTFPANYKSYSPARQACRGLYFVGNDKESRLRLANLTSRGS